MPCEWKGHMANDPRTILVDVTRGNSFLKLKGFLNRDHFACKPTRSHINQKTTLWNTKIQIKVTCILPCFD